MDVCKSSDFVRLPQLSFQTHKMSLATILHYSPIALNRIKKLITGRNAVYLPGYVNHNDLTVADFLGLAILGSEPEVGVFLCVCHKVELTSASFKNLI